MKTRLDVLLVDEGYFESREKAKASIMAGLVFVDGQRVDKAGTPIKDGAVILVKDNGCPYVSRGGLKLKKAIDEFGVSMEGKVAVDMGASTGGFTDCMLKEGAVKVYSIDVGYGQLDYKLRIDERVVNLEKTNIRYMDKSIIEPKADFVSIDVSFISVMHMFPVAYDVTNEDANVLSLIKPQFEAGREQVGKNGIVRDPKIHEEVIEKVIGYARDNNFVPMNLTYSPVKGAKGNIEYLVLLSKHPEDEGEINIKETVKTAHNSLKPVEK